MQMCLNFDEYHVCLILLWLNLVAKQIEPCSPMQTDQTDMIVLSKDRELHNLYELNGLMKRQLQQLVTKTIGLIMSCMGIL